MYGLRDVTFSLKTVYVSCEVVPVLISNIMEVPESTLKKWFSSEDGSFNRIILVCDALGVSLADVLKSLEMKKIESVVFSYKQQNFFLSNSLGFKVYWYLVYERKSIQEVLSLFSLSEKDFKNILFKLDRLSLVELGVADKLKLPTFRPVRWRPKGKFMMEIFRSWTNRLVEDALREQERHNLSLQFFQLSRESYTEFESDLRNLEEKYAR